MSDYEDYDEEYYDGPSDHGLYDDDIEIEEEKRNSDQKIIFGQSHQFRLVKDYLFVGEIKDNIKSVQDSLGISSGKALWLLQKVHYDLSQAQNPSSKLIDEIYASSQIAKINGECILCCDDTNLAQLECNHQFCSNCWTQYLEVGIKQGCEFALIKKCPMDKCKQIVDIDFFKKYLKDSSYKMYETFLLQDYMSRNKKTISCPGKKCENIILLNTYKGSLKSFDDALFNVSCDCTYSFCSLCRDEAHRPLNCQKMKQWQALVGGKSSDTIDALWIKLNTKKCPKCKIDIEKNQGCMHMTCKKCTYEFCWLCMGDWKNHQECNKYSQVHQKEQDEIKQSSEAELKRYTFFSERFIQHRKSIEFAIKKKKLMEESYPILNAKLETIINFDFMNDALLTIVECRRAVAYSYPLGYYIDPIKRNLVEFLQKELEGNLEKLDHLSDTKLEGFYDSGQKIMNTAFFNFQRDIKSLSQTLNKYFGNMIDSLEKEMPELNKKSSEKDNKPNKQNSKKGNNNKQSKKQNDTEQHNDNEDEVDKWTCDYCETKNRQDYIFCENCFNQHF